MRHFLPDPIDPAVLARLLEAAHRGPSVGLMQPWRFVRITDDGLRNRIHALVADERQRTAEVLGPRGEEFLRLKVEGILSCGELLIAALSDGREAHVFGRRTLPEMDLCSVACAIQNLWLAARAEGLGMGWVSMFDPEALAPSSGSPRAESPWRSCASVMSRRSIPHRCWRCRAGPAPARCTSWCFTTPGGTRPFEGIHPADPPPHPARSRRAEGSV